MKIKIAILFSFFFAISIQAEEEEEKYSPKTVDIPKSPSIPLKKPVIPTLHHTNPENKGTSTNKEFIPAKNEPIKNGIQNYTSAGLVRETPEAPSRKLEAEIKPAPEHQKSKIKIRTEDPAGN